MPSTFGPLPSACVLSPGRSGHRPARPTSYSHGLSCQFSPRNITAVPRHQLVLDTTFVEECESRVGTSSPTIISFVDFGHGVPDRQWDQGPMPHAEWCVVLQLLLRQVETLGYAHEL